MSKFDDVIEHEDSEAHNTIMASLYGGDAAEEEQPDTVAATLQIGLKAQTDVRIKSPVPSPRDNTQQAEPEEDA